MARTAAWLGRQEKEETWRPNTTAKHHARHNVTGFGILEITVIARNNIGNWINYPWILENYGFFS